MSRPKYARGRETSKAAAEAMEVPAGHLQISAYQYIVEHGGLTDEQLEVLLQVSHQCASARRNELMEMGYVRDSGMKRRNRSGYYAIVWVPGTQEDLVSDKPAKNRVKTPVKLPSVADMQFSVDFLGGLGKTSPEVGRVLDWLRFLVTEGRGK